MRVLAATTIAFTVALLGGAGVARAGCSAEVVVEPPPPGLVAGAPWHAQILVLQHGVTPLARATPRVEIENDATGERRSFRARPLREVGWYRADVEFPTSGSWSYAVFDGFTAFDGSTACARTHQLGTADVDGRSGTGGDVAAAFGALVTAVGAATLVGARRRRRG